MPARANLEDVDISLESSTRKIEVHKDGTSVETIEMNMKVLKESGKDKLVSIPLMYNAANSQLKVLEAKVVDGDQSYPVDLSHIEDKPLASSPQGFDQNNQMLIAFPHVAINAVISLKYQITIKEPALPGFFAADFSFGNDGYWKTSKIEIDSELPLFKEFNNDEKLLTITENKRNNKYHLVIEQKKPLIKVAIDEDHVSTNSDLYPWVSVSSLNNWTTMGSIIQSKYESVLNQKMPALLEKIAEEAKTKATLVDKINCVTTRLAENVTYMGDWRTIKGAFVPRDLEEIVKSKIGDCKDFSVTTTAILRKIGIPANVALVSRGGEPYEAMAELPTMYAFNHAFVRVLDNGKSKWVDPTNFTSFAQGTYPDIANRHALVLDAKKPTLELTTAIEPKDSVISVVKRITLPKNQADMAEVSGKISLSGVRALPLIGADLRASKESINQDIIRAVADESKRIKWEIGKYNLTSRIAHDVNVDFNFTEKHTQMKTTAGNAFLLPSHSLIAKLLTKTTDRVTDLHLEDPGIYRFETTLPKASLVGKEFC